jgi:tartrate dehydrogenase/decarboxylase/D-malate dehydrogenase
MKTYRIAVIAGDGIGKEVVPAGIDVIQSVATGQFSCEFTQVPWGCDYYLQTGRMMDADGIDRLLGFDAIYLGAIGDPRVADHISARELILPLRQRLGQYVNLRPMRLLPGIASPLAGRGAADIDMICVRENSEGEYCGIGGRLHAGTASELAEQTGVFTRMGIERIARYAFRLAATRPRKMLASATKSNALQHVMVLWDEVVAGVAKEFPEVELRKYHVDALAARMITHPQTLDVIVASNLFGDILTDIGSAISGSLGVAPGGNINPERTTPSMFEPIHGSAPDIAGKGIANPIAAIWAGAMMLDHLGERAAHDRILRAIESVLSDERVKTPDLGGRATTAEMTAAVTSALMASSKQPA